MTSVETLAFAQPSGAVTRPDVEFSLQPGERMMQGLHRILVQQAELGAWNLDRASTSDSAVHEVRKATKRIRSVLRMVRDDIGRTEYVSVNARVRDIARELSGVRSAVVQVEVLEALITEERGLDAEIRSLRSNIAVEADRQRHALDESLLDDLAKRFHAVRHDIDGLQFPDDERVPAGGISRTYRRGRRSMNHAYTVPTITNFHIWRKQVKYLRHQLEILEERGRPVVASLVSDLEEIGETLGADHDLADLERAVDRATTVSLPTRSREHISAVIGRRRIMLERNLKPMSARAYEAKPALFVEQVFPAPG